MQPYTVNCADRHGPREKTMQSYTVKHALIHGSMVKNVQADTVGAANAQGVVRILGILLPRSMKMCIETR